MRHRTITQGEFIKVTRGITMYDVPINGDMININQTIGHGETRLEITFAVQTTHRPRITELLVKTSSISSIPQSILTLPKKDKKDMYDVLKSLINRRLN